MRHLSGRICPFGAWGLGSGGSPVFSRCTFSLLLLGPKGERTFQTTWTTTLTSFESDPSTSFDSQALFSLRGVLKIWLQFWKVSHNDWGGNGCFFFERGVFSSRGVLISKYLSSLPIYISCKRTLLTHSLLFCLSTFLSTPVKPTLKSKIFLKKQNRNSTATHSKAMSGWIEWTGLDPTWKASPVRC